MLDWLGAGTNPSEYQLGQSKMGWIIQPELRLPAGSTARNQPTGPKGIRRASEGHPNGIRRVWERVVALLAAWTGETGALRVGADLTFPAAASEQEVAFPLTPARSLGERENPRPR